MSELMELVEELATAKASVTTLTAEMKQMQQTVERQMEALATSNPALIDSLKRARDEATLIFGDILPQVQPGSGIRQQIMGWLELHSARGN